VIDPALLEWARLPGPTKVLAEARRRREAGYGIAGRPLRVTLTPAERDQVGKLLGMTWVLSGRQVSMKGVAAAIQSLDSDLDTLLTEAGGALRDLPAERAAARQGADRERALAASALTAAGVPAEVATSWLARRGQPRAGSGHLLELAQRCGQVWRNLPGPGGSTVLLTVLAAETLGDPHALDRGSAAAAGLLRLLGSDMPATAEDWRGAWEEAGVVCDPVSSRVLVLNLILRGDAAACRLTAAAGPEPVWLTWRSLSGSFDCEAAEIHVCENPSVVIAAADQLGGDALPLVCTNGRPSAAVRRLLSELAARNVIIHARADDDTAGREIIAALRAAIPSIRPWRYPPILAAKARYEEQDLALLLHDLRAPGDSAGPR
jgi:uncharacterized protein (TIGR02679 family)